MKTHVGDLHLRQLEEQRIPGTLPIQWFFVHLKAVVGATRLHFFPDFERVDQRGKGMTGN